jgi:hypothetical protein
VLPCRRTATLYHVFSLSLVSLFFFSLTTYPESILFSSRQLLISLQSRANDNDDDEECAQRERNLFTVPCLSSIRPEDNQTELGMGRE